MFAIGDKIVYPMHGAGVIEDTEENVILGEKKKYYVVRVSYTDMKIMVPVESCDLVGVRPIISSDRLPEVTSVLRAESTPMQPNWNRRYRDNMELLKSGDILKVAGVVRNLVRADKIKKLSTGEKKLMQSARQILVSEIALAGNMSGDEAGELVDGLI